MKKLTLPLLACACVAIVLTPASASANDKNDRHDKHKKHHHDDHDQRDNRVVVIRERPQVVYRERPHVVVRREYPRQVVVYENRSYGYNYYEVQSVLSRDGYYRGPLDGDFGPGSRAALVRYQRDHGWRDDGRIDGHLIVNLGLGH